ncbi:MAG: alanine racemase [Chloroflexi bacterium]|nr:alanine racemase [Chloroflexota bacterium]
MLRGRPTWAEINLDAVAHNVRELKRHIGRRVDLLAVVKANGYGHGAVQVAMTALESGARWLGVACVDEGIQLRRAGIDCPILIIGYSPPWEVEHIVDNALTPTVNTRQFVLALSSVSLSRKRVTPVHVKVDTGLTRFGLLPVEVVDFVKGIVTLPGIQLEGLYTHFSSADEPDKSFTIRQLGMLQEVLDRVSREGIVIPLRHAANSAATLDLPETHLDLVRCGISIYGLYPSDGVSRAVKLQPAMVLKSRVARLRQVPAGTPVSYGRTYQTPEAAHLALVPIGYGDGVARSLSNLGSMLVRGQRVPIVGRVCMDNCVVNVQDVPDVRQDDEVVIIGKQGDGEITAEEIALMRGTINYEVTCSVGPRVPRVYVRKGKVVEVENLLD